MDLSDITCMKVNMNYTPPIFNQSSMNAIRIFLTRTGESVCRKDMISLMRDISHITASIQMLLLLLTMFVGYPGVYLEGQGFMYISDNFCTKKLLAGLFVFATLPSWVLLACSVSMEKDIGRRKLLLLLISTPFPIGIGIVFFSLCTTPGLHYVYVNLFVATVATVHFAVAHTAGHFNFLQIYFVVLMCTTIAGGLFVLFALIERGPGVYRNAAVISEYVAVGGFIFCNSLCNDRIREHIQM
jgi:hypothetical protein